MSDILQSILFPKSSYNIEQINEYLFNNNLKHKKIDNARNYNYYKVTLYNPNYIKAKYGLYDVKIQIMNNGIKKIIFYKYGTDGSLTNPP